MASPQGDMHEIGGLEIAFGAFEGPPEPGSSLVPKTRWRFFLWSWAIEDMMLKRPRLTLRIQVATI